MRQESIYLWVNKISNIRINQSSFKKTLAVISNTLFSNTINWKLFYVYQFSVSHFLDYPFHVPAMHDSSECFQWLVWLLFPPMEPFVHRRKPRKKHLTDKVVRYYWTINLFFICSIFIYFRRKMRNLEH